jgi:hypothetical protein
LGTILHCSKEEVREEVSAVSKFRKQSQKKPCHFCIAVFVAWDQLWDAPTNLLLNQPNGHTLEVPREFSSPTRQHVVVNVAIAYTRMNQQKSSDSNQVNGSFDMDDMILLALLLKPGYNHRNDQFTMV